MCKLGLILFAGLTTTLVQAYDLKPLKATNTPLHSTPEEYLASGEDYILTSSQIGMQEYRLRLKTCDQHEKPLIKPIFQLYKELFKTQKELIITLPKESIPTPAMRAEINRLHAIYAIKEQEIRDHQSWVTANPHLPAWRQADHLMHLNDQLDQIRAKITCWENLFPYRHSLISVQDPKFQYAQTLHEADQIRLNLKHQQHTAHTYGNTPELANQIEQLNSALKKQLEKAQQLKHSELTETQKSE